MSRHAARHRRRKEQYKRQCGKCPECGCEMRIGRGGKWRAGGFYPKTMATWDHIIPRSRGGSNTLDNMRLICLGCNEAKGDTMPEVGRGFAPFLLTA